MKRLAQSFEEGLEYTLALCVHKLLYDRNFENVRKRIETTSIGAGVSGGSKGARFGPSIMPGGDKECYKEIQPIFEAAAANVKEEPCVSYLGITSSGHYVKMIHNGIEYAIMQLISENYHVLKYGLKRSNDEIHKIFKSWNEGLLESYLVEISRDIFKAKDSETGSDLIDVILDKAKQKGTGKWTSQSAMDFGVSIPTIDSSRYCLMNACSIHIYRCPKRTYKTCYFIRNI